MKGRMIYVGSMATRPDRDSGWVREFGALGWDVETYSSDLPYESTLFNRLQRRIHVGPQATAMQKGLLNLVRDIKPAWVHFRLPIGISKATIQQIKAIPAVVTEYFNDDPFSNQAPFGLHWQFRHALSTYDAHYVYRAHNIKAFLGMGARQVQHCPPSYDPARHYYIGPPADDKFESDAAFIGHWEGDWRMDCLEALHNAGFKVVIKGGGWNKVIKAGPMKDFAPVEQSFADEYNQTYAKTNAGLCFFSKINRDSWTERALEIVAVGGVLVCERTEEAMNRFKDREEAFFFSSIDELLVIVGAIKSDPGMRERVRQAGYNRLLQGNDTIRDRAEQIERFVMDTLQRRLTQQESDI